MEQKQLFIRDSAIMDHRMFNLSKAIIAYHGYGKNKTPVSDDHVLAELYGHKRSLELLSDINKIEDRVDAMAKDIDHVDLEKACTELHKKLTEIYSKELTQEAISAIVWNFVYNVWWK